MLVNRRASFVLLLALLLLSAGVAGCLAAPAPVVGTTDDAEPTFDMVAFEAEFEAGAFAFLVELNAKNRSSDESELLHWYEYAGFGSKPEHTVAFLVPLDYLDQHVDLEPGDVAKPVMPPLGHVYVSAPLWPGNHVVSFRSAQDHVYVNPSSPNGNTPWMLGGSEAGWFPNDAGFYWLVFAGSVRHKVEFTLTGARLVDGPFGFGEQALRVLTSDKEFSSDFTVSTSPTPAGGMTVSHGTSTTVEMAGPSYVQATTWLVGDEDGVDFQLIDPEGNPVEMRQKVYSAAVAGVGGLLLGHEGVKKQADEISLLSGAWRVEIGLFAQPDFEFRPFVLSLADLGAYDLDAII